MESLYLLPMCTPLTVLVFVLVGDMAKAAKGAGRCLFVEVDANHYTGTRGVCATSAVAIGWGGSIVSMVVGIWVFRLICHV